MDNNWEKETSGISNIGFISSENETEVTDDVAMTSASSSPLKYSRSRSLEREVLDEKLTTYKNSDDDVIPAKTKPATGKSKVKRKRRRRRKRAVEPLEVDEDDPVGKDHLRIVDETDWKILRSPGASTLLDVASGSDERRFLDVEDKNQSKEDFTNNLKKSISLFEAPRQDVKGKMIKVHFCRSSSLFIMKYISKSFKKSFVFFSDYQNP